MVTGFLGELLVEVVGHLALGVVSVVVGMVVGSVIFVLVRAVRRSLAEASATRVVVAPSGDSWDLRVEIVPPAMHFPVSRTSFAMRSEHRRRRRMEGVAEDAVPRTSWLHPVGLTDRADEAAVFVAPVLLVLVVVGFALFLIEAAVVLVVLAVAATVRLLRSSWAVHVSPPVDPAWRESCPTLSEARARVDELASQIGAGIVPERPHAQA